MNPNGRLAVYANKNGEFFGRRLVDELNKIIEEGNKKRFLRDKKEKISLKKPIIKEFPNSMIMASLEERVRGEDAFLVQWFSRPPGVKNSKYSSSRNKEEFFHTVNALLNAGVKRLGLVMPYVYDQRKDTHEGRDAIGALLFCQQLVGITHYERMNAFCLDIHAQQIEGFYEMANINMVSIPIFSAYVNFIKEKYPELLENSLIVAPDLGSAKRGRAYSELIELPIGVIDKRRISPTKVIIEVLAAKGVRIEGKKGLLIDDILGSGGTAGEAIAYLKENKGLKEAYWLITHPEITDLERLDKMFKENLFEKIFIADTTRLPKRDYFVQVPTSRLMAKIIYNIHIDQSIGNYLKY